MKKLCWILLIFLFEMCAPKSEVKLLPEVANKPSTKATVSLNSDKKGEWTLYFGLQDKNAPQNPDELAKSDFKKIDATVPGNVEIDLLKAGIIENPEKGDNVWQLRKYETYQWWYQRSFKKPELKNGERIELCFDGIDCIADIWLNNKKIARTEDMFVENHYDVTDLLESNNEISVCIYSTVLEARKHLRNNFGVRYDALAEAVSIRKAAHMFGWDIMPRLISAGLWKDVKLEIIAADYWESVYCVTKNVNVENKTADLYIDWQFNTNRFNIDDLTLKISLSRNNKISYEKSS
jgi:beta-mannosidase